MYRLTSEIEWLRSIPREFHDIAKYGFLTKEQTLDRSLAGRRHAIERIRHYLDRYIALSREHKVHYMPVTHEAVRKTLAAEETALAGLEAKAMQAA